MKLNEILTLFDNYEVETKTLIHKREAGLFALLNSVILKVILLELNGYKVDNLHIEGGCYIRKFNLYPSLFEMKNEELNFDKFSEEEKKQFLDDCITTPTGLSRNPKNLNFEITNQVISKFFTPNPSVLSWYRTFLSYLNVNPKDLIFVWARKTDKISETTVPTAESYKKYLDRIVKKNKKILLQTDDLSVIEEFKSLKIDFETLPHIKFNNSRNKPFHINLCDIPDKEFEKINGISKIEHLRQMVAIALIAKNAGTSIIYPGNPSTFIPIIKGTSDNCLLFKNGYNLF